MATPSILLVEDEAGLRELYEDELQKAGYLVFAVGNGEEGLSIAASRLPSIILLDVMLPGQSGLDVLAILKANQKTANIPVVMMSALEDTDDRARGMSLGAKAYWGKNEVDPTSLVDKIKQLIG